eukprot:Em0001g111a
MTQSRDFAPRTASSKDQSEVIQCTVTVPNPLRSNRDQKSIVEVTRIGCLTGFVDIGDINCHLADYEKQLSNDNIRDPLASSVLVLMVRGLFTALKFPYAQFPCTDLSGDKFFPLVWNAVSCLENLGFTVVALCCDGLSANRKFFRLQDAGSEAPVHRVVNPYAHDSEKCCIFFLSDPPHLMKTVRNCWSNPKRRLWCNGMPISWDHLKELYTKNRAQADDTGLALIPKLKFEHIHLTSYSKMRVDLAAQVILSNSVAKGLLLFVGDKASQTARFAEMFDRFFDYLNSSRLTDVFLPYLDKWENCVDEREGFDKSQRSMMLLSKETRQGLKLTVMSFVELVQYLFTIPGVTVFLGNRICRDPLENFFGQQRQKGRANGNPSSSEFIATLKRCVMSPIHVALYVAIVEVVSPLIVTW